MSTTLMLAGPFVNQTKYKDLLPFREPKPGSVKDVCETCKEEVWIGPSQQDSRALAKVPVSIFCFICAVKVARGQPVNIVALSKEGHLYDTSKPN